MDTLFRKSLLAGLIIGLGANAYLFCGRSIAGAAFFSIGIILIMMFQLPLYTGYVPSSAPLINPCDTGIILFGNICGAAFIGACENYIFPKEYIDNAAAIINNSSPIKSGISAIFCGVIIGLIVLNKSKYRYVMAIPLITIFIKSGFQHSIAYCFYMLLGWKFNLLTFVAIIIGNWIGGYITGVIINENNYTKTSN